MAKRGAQPGNNNAAKNKPWAQALAWMAEHYEDIESRVERGQALREIARKCFADALAGDKDARREIGDRLDGKPKQQVEATGEGGGPLTVQLIQFARDYEPDDPPAE